MKLNPIVKKELISLFRRDHISKAKQVVSFLLSTLFNFVLVAFVVALFTLFYNKSYTIISTNGIPAPLLVFILFMVIVFGAYSLFTMNTLSNSLYNKNDRFILRVMPIKETSIILPKLGSTYIKLLLTFGVMFLSLMLTFGILVLSKPCVYVSIGWYYWPLSIIFTFISPFFIIFIGTIFSYPFHLLKGFIGRHPVIQIIVSIVIISILSLAYFLIIDAFAYLVRSDSLSEILRPSNCDFMKSIVEWMVPINYMILSLVNATHLIYLLVFIAALVIALSTTYFIAMGYYHRYIKIDDRFSVIKLQEPKLSKYPLLKKDFKLMFRNTSGSVSFIVLAFISAIFSTFLAYFVGVLFKSYGIDPSSPSINAGSNYAALAIIPYLYFPLIVLFVTLSISIIFATETKLFIKEKATASVILTMPQTFKKQILSKMLLNSILLFAVNLLVFILVISIGILAPLDAFILFLLSLFVTFSTFLLTVSHTLAVTKSLTATSDIATTGNFNYLISIFFPFVIFIITGGLLIGAHYSKLLVNLSPIIIYLVVAAIAAIILAFSIFMFIRRTKKFSKFLSEGGISK